MNSILIDLSLEDKYTFRFGNIPKEINAKFFGSFKNAINKKPLTFTDDTTESERMTLLGMFAPVTPTKVLTFANINSRLASNPMNVVNVINAMEQQRPAVKALYAQLSTEGIIPLMRCNEMLAAPMTFFSVGNWYHYALPEFIFTALRLCNAEDMCDSFWTSRIAPSSVVCSLSQEMIHQIGPALLGQDFFEPHTVDTLPEGLTTVSFMEETLTEANTLIASIMTKKILTPSGNITEKKLQTFAAQLSVGDFPGKQGCNRRTLVAIAMSAYAMYISDGELPISINPFAKFLTSEFSKMLCKQIVCALLPEVHLIGTQFDFSTPAEVLQLQNVNDLLKHHAADTWLDIRNLIPYLNYVFGETVSSDKYIVPFVNVHYDNIVRADCDDRTNRINYYADIVRPFFYRYVKMLAACGVLEVAFDASCSSAFEGMCFVRLTPFGRSAFGLDEHFHNPNEFTPEQLFDIDDDNLIVTALMPEAVEVKILRECADAIGGNRYRLSNPTFMQGCYEAKQVEQRIRNFTDIVCPNPGPRITDFLNTLKQRCHCTNPLTTDFTIISINPEVPGLIDFLSTSAYVKQYAYKAQGHYLLIETKRVSELRTLLLRNGFML